MMTCAAALEHHRLYRMLVVDDDAAIRSALASVLETTWVEVATAASLEEAKRLLSADLDLVITDLRLRDRTDTDGLELVAWIRHHRPQLPVIVLTAYGSSNLRLQAKRLGAVDLWFKSMKMPELLEQLHRLGMPVTGGSR